MRAGLASISMAGRLAGHPPTSSLTSNLNSNSISGAGSTSRKKRTRSTSPTTVQGVNQGVQRSTGKRGREEPDLTGDRGRGIRGGVEGGDEDEDEDDLDVELDRGKGTGRRRRTSVDGPRGKRMRRDGSGDPGKKSGARSRSRIGLLGQGGVQEERDENDDDGDDDDDEDEQAEDEEDVGVLLGTPAQRLVRLASYGY